MEQFAKKNKLRFRPIFVIAIFVVTLLVVFWLCFGGVGGFLLRLFCSFGMQKERLQVNLLKWGFAVQKNWYMWQVNRTSVLYM